MKFSLRPISPKRMEELKQIKDFSDIPDDFYVLLPLRIYDVYVCSDDEHYVLYQLDTRWQNEINRRDSCFLLFYGQNHLFFDAYVEDFYQKNEGDDYYYTRNIWIRKNSKIDDLDNKEEMVVIIKEALTGRYQPYPEKNVKQRKVVCTIYYNEEIIK